MAFKKLNDLLTVRLKQNGIERDVAAARILEVANTVLAEYFGDQVLEREARAISFKRQQVQIATTNASLRQELVFREQDLLQRIHEKLGREALIQRIQVII